MIKTRTLLSIEVPSWRLQEDVLVLSNGSDTVQDASSFQPPKHTLQCHDVVRALSVRTSSPRHHCLATSARNTALRCVCFRLDIFHFYIRVRSSSRILYRWWCRKGQWRVLMHRRSPTNPLGYSRKEQVFLKHMIARDTYSGDWNLPAPPGGKRKR